MYLYIYLTKKNKFKLRACKNLFNREIGQYRNSYDHVLLAIFYYDVSNKTLIPIKEKILRKELKLNLYKMYIKFAKPLKRIFTPYHIIFLLILLNMYLLLLVMFGINI